MKRYNLPALLLFAAGCAGLPDAEDSGLDARVANPVADRVWRTGDDNANGVIDRGEQPGQTLTLQPVAGLPALPQPSQPGFREDEPR